MSSTSPPFAPRIWSLAVALRARFYQDQCDGVYDATIHSNESDADFIIDGSLFEQYKAAYITLDEIRRRIEVECQPLSNWRNRFSSEIPLVFHVWRMTMAIEKPEPVTMHAPGNELCYECDGTRICIYCRGRGEVAGGRRCSTCTGDGRCIVCNGSGELLRGSPKVANDASR